MRALRTVLAALVCGAGMAAAAHAADMPGSWSPVPELRKQVFTELVSGWYVRGDIGYRSTSVDSVDSPMSQPGADSRLQTGMSRLGLQDYTTQLLSALNLVDPVALRSGSGWDVKSVPSFGIGAGYKYQWLRLDATLDYAYGAELQGKPGTAGSFYSNRFDTLTLLANVYLDLGEWGGFTPYVGAGVGTSYIKTRPFRVQNVINLPGMLPGEENGQWNLAWALMGGVAYQISPKLLLDVSYRYLNLGDAVHGYKQPLDMLRLDFHDLSAQEVRVGLRWVLD